MADGFTKVIWMLTPAARGSSEGLGADGNTVGEIGGAMDYSAQDAC